MDSPVNQPGHIQLIIGPMFSGKSTELLRRTRRYTIATRKCLVIKFHKDTRYSALDMATHDKQTHVARPCEKLSEVMDAAKGYDVIAIDEGQFFSDIVDFCETMANEGKIVIVAALDGTFQRKPFGHVLDLVPLCESIVKLNAVCQVCYRSAAFSARTGNETEEVVIGGAEKYIAACRQCFQRMQSEKKPDPIKEPNTNTENLPLPQANEIANKRKLAEMLQQSFRPVPTGTHLGRDL